MVSAPIARVMRPRGRRHPAHRPLQLVSVVAIWALGLGPVLAWPRTAEASGTECTRTGLGYLCSQVDGRGVHVGDVRAWLETSTWTCNKELRVRGTLADGGGYMRSGMSQCDWIRVSLRFDVDKDFENGSYVCVGVREHGSLNPWEPYEACTRVRS